MEERGSELWSVLSRENRWNHEGDVGEKTEKYKYPLPQRSD
jgi:hypothetical protein